MKQQVLERVEQIKEPGPMDLFGENAPMEEQLHGKKARKKAAKDGGETSKGRKKAAKKK